MGDSTRTDKTKRGFAALTPERRAEIGRQGGQTAWKRGNAHRWTPGEDGEAAEAGRKSGAKRTSAEMRELARRRWAKRQQQADETEATTPKGDDEHGD